MDNQTQAPSWRVVTQQETTRPDPTGRYVSGMLVTYQTSSGNSGSVFVPDSQYTPEYVRQVIMARVALTHSVSSLQG